MTEFKVGDKLWWVCEEMGGVKVYPVVVTNPSASAWCAQVEHLWGDNDYPFKNDLYRSHAEAVQALMESVAVSITESHREQGWK